MDAVLCCACSAVLVFMKANGGFFSCKTFLFSENLTKFQKEIVSLHATIGIWFVQLNKTYL
jgi:hypothetical protein